MLDPLVPPELPGYQDPPELPGYQDPPELLPELPELLPELPELLPELPELLEPPVAGMLSVCWYPQTLQFRCLLPAWAAVAAVSITQFP